MKKRLQILCSVLMGMLTLSGSAVAYGAANPDDAAAEKNEAAETITNPDLITLLQSFPQLDVAALDINKDQQINHQDLLHWMASLNEPLFDTEILQGEENQSEKSTGITKSIFTYGKSVRGRDLLCYCIKPETYSKVILLEFEIHGFEDGYEHDGQVLVDTANALIRDYSEAADLNETCLLIIPSSNPDALLDGNTNYGFGRCNANGIDLNRDFDANYRPVFSIGRNYTPYAFSGKESAALRDLYDEYKPDIVLDFHGWESSLIGDERLKKVFHEIMGLSISHSFTATNAKGYFANWAHQQGSLAMLVEFTSPTEIDLAKLEQAIDSLIYDQY